jgi:acetolactate synthase-1/3 small subunit
MTSEVATTSYGRVRVLSLIVEDHPGVLERVASQVRRRGFNIQSLTVGPVGAGRSRMTVTVDAGHAEVDQVAKQVDKLVEVIEVHDITDHPIISRELIVARVSVPAAGREGFVAKVSGYGGQVIDATGENLVVELSAAPERVEGFLALLQPYGLAELARSGPVAMLKSTNGSASR